MRRLYLAESLTSSPRYARTMELRYYVCVGSVSVVSGVCVESVCGECVWGVCVESVCGECELCGERTHTRAHIVHMFTGVLSPGCQLRIMLNSNGNIFPPYLRVSYSSWTLNTESNTASLPVRRFSFLSFPSLSFPPFLFLPLLQVCLSFPSFRLHLGWNIAKTAPHLT